MPRLILQALEGRTVDQKRELVRKLTDAVVEVYGVAPSEVTVFIEVASFENYAKGGVLKIDEVNGH